MTDADAGRRLRDNAGDISPMPDKHSLNPNLAKRKRSNTVVWFVRTQEECIWFMPSTSSSKAIPMRNFQAERLDQRFDEIVGRLKAEHLKIEGMVSRLLSCLAAVQIVEQSVDANFSAGSIDEIRRALADAQTVLKDISDKLNRMGARLP